MRSAVLITGSIKRVWALRHQTGAQYSAVEYTRARVAVRRTEAPAPQVVPASRLINETLVLAFFAKRLQVSPVRERSIQCYAKILWSIREWEWLATQLHRKFTFCFPVGEMEYRRQCFCFAELHTPFLEVRL